jgi:hypothetical protein
MEKPLSHKMPNAVFWPKSKHLSINIDAFAKSRKTPFSVIPAKAGIQEKQALLDPGFRRGDGFDDFLRTQQCSMINDQCSMRIGLWLY